MTCHYKFFICIFFCCLFLNACKEKENIKNEIPTETVEGVWIPQHTKWEKLKEDTTVRFSEIKTYYFKSDSSLIISDGIHLLKHDSISFKNNIHFYYGKWKLANNILSLDYKINEGSGKVIFEEIGIGNSIQLNGEKYKKVRWEVKTKRALID